jgi:heptosyltransferase III
VPNAFTRIELPSRPRILVVALRRLGDVLLTTPLIGSLKRAWPDGTIDVLVFAGTDGILDGNPDIDRVVAMPADSVLGGAALAARLFKRYALAISTQAGDRPTLFALIAGRRHLGQVGERSGDAWKRLALSRSVQADTSVHRVEQVLQLVDALGIERVPRVVPPASRTNEPSRPAGRYAVIHAAPMFRYKRWTDNGWRTLAATLEQRGLSVIATGGPAPSERAYLDTIWRDMPSVQRRDGQLTWADLATVLSRAAVFVGPDTSVTHLAAASGCPTVALYGPTDPRLWGPWPADGLEDSWADAGRVQRRGNVWLVQNPLPCVPCQREGCERHVGSHSVCLDELSPQPVIAAVDDALSAGQRANSPVTAQAP